MLRLAIARPLKYVSEVTKARLKTSKLELLSARTVEKPHSPFLRAFCLKSLISNVNKTCRSFKFVGARLSVWHGRRSVSTGQNFGRKNTNVDIVYYVVSGIIFMIGVSYASVPLYRMFCQAAGLGGDPTIGHKIENVSNMKPIRERQVTVLFNADKHAAMQWNFKPSQPRVKVVPGETALAFYTAKNPTDTPIVGVATYNVVPFQAGPYFNKIQCFCFEEQWLNPHEEVDMPVFFYIDPEFDDDPQLANVDEIVLSYTFFKAEEGQILPIPGFMNSRFKGARPETVS